MSALSVLLSRAHVRLWGRRAWLLHNSHTAITLSAASTLVTRWPRGGAAHGTTPYRSTVSADTAARMVSHADRIDPRAVEALATRAVDAARAAGATYADARLTRIVSHEYSFITGGVFRSYDEVVGVGVRVLVNGYWGFAASPFWEPDEVVQLAQDAVAQAKENMLGTPRAVDLGHIPVATGTWSTPLRIDPFTVPIEEKLDYIRYCSGLAGAYGLSFVQNGTTSGLAFARQERVVATSEGAAFTQTLYESGGVMELQLANASGNAPTRRVQRIETAGLGWERLLDAGIPTQFGQIAQELNQQTQSRSTAPDIGRYTIVCDGATMASLVNRTWGLATQLDRALGYEANADGTSILTDPLGMLGQLQVASPQVTLTANRSAPTQLATVRWDDEGVEPETFPLITKGTLVDFQTTREQATWLAPYYQQQHRAVRSHGCAGAESGLSIPIQHMPNFALEPLSNGISVNAMVAAVPKGLLIEDGWVTSDFQASEGILGETSGRSGTGGSGELWPEAPSHSTHWTFGRVSLRSGMRRRGSYGPKRSISWTRHKSRRGKANRAKRQATV